MYWSNSILVLAALIPAQAPVHDFIHDFRGAKMPAADRIVLNGVDKMVEATPEDGGLRIKILANRGKAGAGIQTKFSLSGDFEITASYEILSADKPTTGYGVGVYLTISPSAWKSKRAALARCWTAQGDSGFQPVIIIAEPPTNRSGWEPSQTMKGQLRLRREGAKLFYLVNEGLGQPFREVFQCDYGTDNIDMIRLVANPGTSPAALDVRLLDVRMHWGSLPDHAKTAAVPEKVAVAKAPDKAAVGQASDKKAVSQAPDKTAVGQMPDKPAVADQAPDAQSNPRSHVWLTISLFVGVAFVLALALSVGLHFYLRRRRGNQIPSKVPGKKATSVESSLSVAIACTACGKRLKFKADFEGKRVKCPHCHSAVLVPEAKEQ